MKPRDEEASLRNELTKVKAQLRHIEDAYRKLGDEKRVLENRTSFLQSNLEKVQTLLQEQETKLKEIQSEKARYYHESTEKAAEIQHHQEQIAHFSESIQTGETRLQKDRETIQQQIDELQNRNNHLKEQIALFNTRMGDIQRKLNAKEGLIEQMNSQRNQLFKASADVMSYIHSDVLPEFSPPKREEIEFAFSEFHDVLQSVAPLRFRVLFKIVGKEGKKTLTEIAQELNEDKKTIKTIIDELQARQWIKMRDNFLHVPDEVGTEMLPPHEWDNLPPVKMFNELLNFARTVTDQLKVSRAILKTRTIITSQPSLSLALRREAMTWAEEKGDFSHLKELLDQWKQKYAEVPTPEPKPVEDAEVPAPEPEPVEDAEVPAPEPEPVEDEIQESSPEEEDNGE